MIIIHAKKFKTDFCQVSSVISTPKSKYAIIGVGGKQKIVEEGRYYICNRLQASVGSVVRFCRIMAIKDQETITYGKPWLPTSSVSAEILETFKGKKTIVYKMKPKKHSRSKKGQRQELTRFVVQTIRA